MGRWLIASAIDREAVSVAVRQACLSAVALLLVACEGPTGSTSADTARPQGSTVVVARAGGSTVALEDLRSSVGMQLYDLELQRYRALRDATIAAVLEQIDSGNESRVAELSIEPPRPPRLDIAADPRRLRGDASSAPIEIVVFCNFESPHCERLQTRLDLMSSLYGGLLAVGLRDLILPFHVNAGLAAEAARCALEQGAFWRFHDALYASSGALDQSRLERAAATASLDIGAFDRCLAAGRFRGDVEADTELASELGLTSVPSVFVNGLYAGLEPQNADFIWLIERELARLDIDSPREQRASLISRAPIVIDALLHSQAPGHGLVLATIDGRLGVFNEGERLSDSIMLRAITAEGLELLSDGMPEALPLRMPAAAPPAGDAASQDASSIPPHVAVPLQLDRTEVLARLADRRKLNEALEPAALRVDGYRLLRLRDVDPASLYALLGLEVGDLIATVNEQLIHEGENPLWQALEREDEVRLRVIRQGGLAQHFTYRFDD